MALVNTGTQTTLDESTSLQNSFTSASTAGDANDNDIAVGLLPSDFSARLSALSAGTPLRAALSGYTGVAGNTGSNILTFTPTGSAVDVWFTDSSSQALNGLDSGLDTASGESIFLYTDGVNNNVLLGKTSGGTIVMAAYLQETGTPISGAKLWTVQFEAMYHPDGTQADESLDLAGLVYATVDQERNFSLANAPSGQNLFLMYGDAEVALIATGKLPANQSTGQAINTGDTLNSSQAGGTITLGVNNQMVDPDEGLWFTFVSGANTNYTVPNLSEGEADVEANIAFTGLVNSQAATFQVVQLQKDKAATVRVTAYSTDVESGAAYVDGLGDADDVKVNITLVQVFDPDGVDVTAARDVTITNGVATLLHVLATDRIHYHTASNHQRVLIENGGDGTDGSASFDVGGFRLLEPQREATSIGAQIRFEDSAPAVTLATPTDTVILNTQDADTEGNATDTDAQSFAAAFTVGSSDYGGDGAGSTVWSYAFSVASQGVDSGLNAAAGNIYLYLIGGQIVGSTSATQGGVTAGNTVFDLAVNSSTGNVTLAQYSAIEHDGPGASSNFDTQEAVLGTGLAYLNATATITDQDGDSTADSKSIDLGGNVAFDDDGPGISQSEPTDTVVLNTQDAETEGSASDSDAKSFAASFALAGSDYGADGAGSTVWSYAFSVASQGAFSGLNAADGDIRVYLIGGQIVGSTSATLGGVTAGNTVFDLAVNSSTGNVTLTQYSAIEHDGPGASSNFDAQEAVLGTGVAYLNATATITDHDGDTHEDVKSIDLGGNVAFDDDGPSITQAAPTDTVVVNTQDADTEGSATDTDAQSFAAAFTVGSSDYGADGAGSTVWSYAFSVASQGVDSGLNAAAGNIYLYLIGGQIVGSTSATQGGVAAGNTVFDLAVNSSTGNVTLAQYSAIEHDGPGATSNFDTQEAVLGTGLAYLNATATITDHDGDTHEDTESLDLGGNVAFDDDGPAVVQAAPTDTVVLNTQDDESKGAATDTDVQSFASSFTLSSADYGGDGAGSEVWSYAFSLTTQGGDSGLNAETGDIRLYLIGGKIIGSTGLTAGDITADNTIFDLEVNASTGAVTLTQYSAVEHPGPGWDKDHVLQEVLLATDLAYLNATVTITDEDGDSHQHTQSLDLGGNVAIDDNGPIVDHFDDLSGPNDGAPMAGTYAFDIAADVVTNDADDGVVLMALSGTTGNGRAIFGTSLSWASESDTQVTYNFGFQYYAGPFDTTANSASGTVMFNKSNGTFEFDMNGLIGGDAMTSTGGPIARYDYDTEGNKSPEIVVQEYTSGIFGVLTGQAALNPSSPASLKVGGNYAFAPGETLSSATVGYINVATATLGVNSDTIQQGELVNFDLYTSNPVAGPTSPPKQSGAAVNTSTQRATTDHLNVVLDQWHEGEDLAIVLKLYNMSTQQITTRLLLADASSDFEAVDKYHVVRIGTGDYDSAVYQICGLQVTTSTDRLTGTGYRLSDGSAKALTADGKGFEDTADNDVIKLVRIDLDTPVITTYDADLNFSGRVIDSDDDWAIFDFDVHIEADAVVTLTGMAGQVPGAVI